MDLPFAVDNSSCDLDQSNSSLVTASSSSSQQASNTNSGFASQRSAGNILDSTTSFHHREQQHEPSSTTTTTTTTTTASIDNTKRRGVSSNSAAVFDNDSFECLDQGQSIILQPEPDQIDFAQYVTVFETDEADFDVVMNPEIDPAGDAVHLAKCEDQGDILALLMSGNVHDGELVVSQCEEANHALHYASEAKKNGDLALALENHSVAAKLFRDAAVVARKKDVALSNALLLLSQTQAKSALSLKEFIKLQGGNSVISSALTQKERLRATVRGALVTRREADISDSIFLGNATKKPETREEQNAILEDITERSSSSTSSQSINAVDEMLELERELRDMDAALELGNSVVSLGARTQNRLKQSTMDGSFMVIPPGSSYMSSSAMWSRPTPQRAKGNRIQPSMGASVSAGISQSTAVIMAPPPPQRTASHTALDASWWGNASTTSQMLAGSVVSIASSRQQESTNTKQLMRLLDSIKTLGDENAALLREVEQAEAARNEAKAAREQMRRFKAEYGKRFSALKSALEKFRTSYPQHQNDNLNPVKSSEFLQSENNHALSDHLADDRLRQKDEQIARQEQMIRKLTAELKKEKDEHKKKDVALRKYESFYREVKARSAEKARQREFQQQQRRGLGGGKS